VRTAIRLPLLVLGCAALVLAAACTSSNDKLEPATTSVGGLPVAEQTLPEGHPTVDPAVADLPVEALLSETDLGPDWAQGSHADDPLAPADSYFCGKTVPSLPWTQVAQFANDQNSNMMIQILSKFPDEAAAKAAVKVERDATVGCSTWSSSTGADKVEWNIESVQTLDFGDEAFAEKSSTAAGGGHAVDFSVMVRKGDVVILIDEGGSDVDGAGTISVARKALDKLQAAVKSQ